jgi:hypothetical protein
MFAWNFLPNVSKFCYKLDLVFKDFSVELLMNGYMIAFVIKINDKGITTKAIWTSTCPKYGE